VNHAQWLFNRSDVHLTKHGVNQQTGASMDKLMRFASIISLFVVSLATMPATTAATLPEDRWLYGSAGYARALELQRELNVPLVVYF
jgi:hypothetical protein